MEGIIPAIKKPDLQTSIIIKLEQDIEFWVKLLAPSLENNSIIHWDDFCKAMIGIGYKIVPQTGSRYRF